VNERKLKRIFPHASKDFIKRNTDNPIDSGSSDIPELLDRKQMGQIKRETTLEEKYMLRRVEVEFFANHGQELDEDNRRFIIKPILDAIVSLGISKTDKEIKSEVTQRFNESDINI
jgi:hypothetical protein